MTETYGQKRTQESDSGNEEEFALDSDESELDYEERSDVVLLCK